MPVRDQEENGTDEGKRKAARVAEQKLPDQTSEQRAGEPESNRHPDRHRIGPLIASVSLSAYISTLPFVFRAARPIVWTSAVLPRRKPSLSASSMATSETSGRSSPSRSRLTPTRTS